ncbi:hypothetical protein D3C87_2207750 [compost metagenome]
MGLINNISVSGNIIGNSSVGGITGYTVEKITSSNSSAKVKGNSNIGGVIRIHIFK